MHKYQQADKKLQKLLRKYTTKFTANVIESSLGILMFKGKVSVPAKIQSRVIEWYSEYLRHLGEVRTEQTIRATMTWPNLKEHVHKYCKACPKSQLAKKRVKSTEITPWERVDVDCVWLYSIRNKTGKEYILGAMTMIDLAPRWFEIFPIDGTPTAEKTMEAFDNTWLCRYPRPKQVGIDYGSEFKRELLALCEKFGLILKIITS